ncbi:flagellar motor protein MotB [Calditrichota bacterium]
MKALSIVSSIVALILAFTTYYFFDAYSKKDAELNDLVKSQQELSQKVEDISKETEEELDKLKTIYEVLTADLKKEIEEGQIKITQLTDKLSVSMVDKILFPSGEAQITANGLKILKRVGDILKNTKNKIIRVEGHTDNMPIAKRLQSKYPTNWELSTERATNVVRFLQDNVGIKGNRLRAVGMSEYHPVVKNDTAKNRSQNRRIEILLMPETVK